MRRRNYIRTVKAAGTSRRRHFLFAAIVLAALYALWSLFVGEMGLVKYYRMRTQAQALRAEIDHLKQDNVRLIQDVRLLKHDAAYIERLARDKIGLARPGEIVYYYGNAASR